jgi:drug/metabolite transporter (DMT)-like permease
MQSSVMLGLLAYGICLLAVLGVIASERLMRPVSGRRVALHGPFIFLGTMVFAAAAAAWVLALRHVSLAQDTASASLFTMLALVTIGVLLFGGKPAVRKVLGIAMAVGSMLLMTSIT